MPESKIEDLFSNLKEYVKLQYDILRLQLTEKAATLGATLVTALILGFIVLLTVILLSITAALYAGDLMGSRTLGFMIVSGFYVLITLIFVLFKGKLIRDPIRDKIINEILKKEAEKTIE